MILKLVKKLGHVGYTLQLLKDKVGKITNISQVFKKINSIHILVLMVLFSARRSEVIVIYHVQNCLEFGCNFPLLKQINFPVTNWKQASKT